MLFGSIKLSSDFFNDNEDYIFDGLRGAATGAVVGGTKDIDKNRTDKTRLKNLLHGTLIGGVSGLGMRYLFEKNKESLHDISNKTWEAITTPIFEYDSKRTE